SAGSTCTTQSTSQDVLVPSCSSRKKSFDTYLPMHLLFPWLMLLQDPNLPGPKRFKLEQKAYKSIPLYCNKVLFQADPVSGRLLECEKAVRFLLNPEQQQLGKNGCDMALEDQEALLELLNYAGSSSCSSAEVGPRREKSTGKHKQKSSSRVLVDDQNKHVFTTSDEERTRPKDGVCLPRKRRKIAEQLQEGKVEPTAGADKKGIGVLGASCKMKNA
ncbi:unnamed protein product, partial [Amoebophrya sp. A120]